MATENVGSIEYTIDAKVDPLLRANKDAEKSVDNVGVALDSAGKSASKFDGAIKKTAEEIKKANGWYEDANGRLRDMKGRFVSAERQAEAFGDATEKSGKKAKGFSVNLTKVATGIKKANQAMIEGAKYAAAMGAALSAITVAASAAGREIKQMAALSNTSVERFQELAFGASQVGVSSEKLGDIFKDVQDKVGDFLATGGGELADYFEKVAPLVGQTAEEFRGLSGPDALIKFKEGLDAANLSASEQIFYLESLANDVSLLQPLLANSGQGFTDAANKARDMGIILSKVQVDNLAGISAEFEIMRSTIGKTTQAIVADNAPDIIEAMQAISQAVVDASKWYRENKELVNSMAKALTVAAAAMVAYRVAVTATTVAVKALNVATKANPIGLLVGAALLAATQVDALAEALGLAADESERLGNTSGRIPLIVIQKPEQPLMPSGPSPTIFDTEQGSFGMTDESGVSAYNQSLQETLGITQELANQLETLDMKFQNIASTIGGTLYDATMSWSDASGQAIAQNIADGKTWNDGLNAVASTIATQLLGSLISLGIQYGINAALKGAADQQEAVSGTAALAEVATAGTIAAQTLASAWAPAAAGAAIATAGGAATSGGTALTTTYGLAQSLSTIGGRLNGGPVSAGGLYDVNENGKPELLTVGNKQMLMMGNQSGSVTSNKDLMASGGGNVSIVVNNHASGAEATATSRQQDGKTIVEVVVADIANRGKIHKAITSNTTANNRT